MLFNKEDEIKILTQLKANDETALRLLYDNYWEQLFISAFNLLKNKEVCEDIIQEVFIKIWQKRQELQIKTSFKGYLFTSVFHGVYDHIRKSKKILPKAFFENLDAGSQKTNPESKLIYKELVAHINSTVELLPLKCQKIYILSREKQLSHKEIAEHLNTSTKNVEAHITKAIKVLKSSLYGFSNYKIMLIIMPSFIC